VDLSSFQITLISLEILARAFGGMLLGRSFNLPGFKPTGSWSGRLAYWPVSAPEAALLFILIILLVIVSQGLLTHFLGGTIKTSSDQPGLGMVVNGLATHGGGLLAWPLFSLVRAGLYADYNTTPPAPASPAPDRYGWKQIAGAGFITWITAFALVALVSWGWTSLLSLLGVPIEPQDSIAIFKNTRSPFVLTGMFVVACVLAPINEEMFFRRGLYHFLRQRFGRTIALSVSASFFGLIHFNLAGFFPLATLGVMLALAYERTGDVRVPMIAHGLFNLNTIIALLAGLSA